MGPGNHGDRLDREEYLVRRLLATISGPGQSFFGQVLVAETSASRSQ